METISETQNRRQTWEFSTLLELHAAANTLLRQAMLNERYKRWKKVNMNCFPDGVQVRSFSFVDVWAQSR